MKIIVSLAIFIAFVLVGQPLCQAQRSGDELRRVKAELQELKEGQKQIQKELEEIKNLLRGADAAARRAAAAAQPPPDISLNVDGLPFKGERNAQLTVIEFSDYQCPFCARYARETFPQVDRDYIKTGKVKYVVSDYPLEDIHPQALDAAQAAACAQEQGKFWEMHDQLFSNQHALSRAELSLHAQAVGLNVPAFQQCLFAGKKEAQVRQARAEAARAGADGTPTFFIGLTTPNDSKVKIVRAFVGAQPYANFKQVLDTLLAAKK